MLSATKEIKSAFLLTLFILELPVLFDIHKIKENTLFALVITIQSQKLLIINT
jgi:hypothetical protein